MKRTTITLPDDTAVLLEREAKRRGTSVSEVARQVFTAHFRPEAEGKRRLPFVGIAASDHTDTAAQAEEILAEKWSRFIEEDSGLAGRR